MEWSSLILVDYILACAVLMDRSELAMWVGCQSLYQHIYQGRIREGQGANDFPLGIREECTFSDIDESNLNHYFCVSFSWISENINPCTVSWDRTRHILLYVLSSFSKWTMALPRIASPRISGLCVANTSFVIKKISFKYSCHFLWLSLNDIKVGA